MSCMDRDQAVALRELLVATSAAPDWVAASAEFGLAVQAAPKSAGGLLVAGPADAEPWHFTAHLADEAQWARLPMLTPTLLRSAPAAGAPAHLSVGWERLTQSGRGEALLVVAEIDPQDELLERIQKARRGGTRILALARSAPELRGIAHETLLVPSARDERIERIAQGEQARPGGLIGPGGRSIGPTRAAEAVSGARADLSPDPGPLTFDTAQHLVSLATTAQPGRRAGLRSRLAKWQDRINGPSVESW